MNLLSEIGKDARQFMREGRTLMLLVAAPLLVLLVMGSIFSGDSQLVGKTAIGICDLDSSNASVYFVNGIVEVFCHVLEAGVGPPLEIKGHKLAAINVQFVDHFQKITPVFRLPTKLISLLVAMDK